MHLPPGTQRDAAGLKVGFWLVRRLYFETTEKETETAEQARGEKFSGNVEVFYEERIKEHIYCQL